MDLGSGDVVLTQSDIHAYLRGHFTDRVRSYSNPPASGDKETDDTDNASSLKMAEDEDGVRRPTWFPRWKSGNFCSKCKLEKDGSLSTSLCKGRYGGRKHFDQAVGKGYRAPTPGASS